MDILVTGTGRCGTGFVAQLLTSAGVPCTHEQVFNREGWEYALESIQTRQANPDWGWRADASWLAFPFLDRPELTDLTVVHLVRHPKKVLDSHLRLMFYNDQVGPYYQWARQYLPGLDEYQRPEDKAACWYLAINWMCEKRADVFHRVEDDSRELLDKLGIEPGNRELFDDTRYNHRGGHGPADVTLEDISPPLRVELEAMCQKYGYTWEDGTQPPVTARWVNGREVSISQSAANLGGGWQVRDGDGTPIPWDSGLLTWFAAQVAQVATAVVLDIGASAGTFAMLPLVCDCQVVAVEPNPAAYKALLDVLKLNGVEDRVTTYQVAMSDQPGRATLRVPSEQIHAALGTLGQPRRDYLDWREIEVDVKTIDGLDLAHVDFIKVDTEGNELAVLKGGEQTIKRDQPAILTEYTSDNTRQFGYEREEIRDLLAGWGYTTLNPVGVEDLWATT